MHNPKVAFVCVHNSCRSQMAEALAKLFVSDVYSAYSAGTEVAPQINPDAVVTIQELYNVDMSIEQYSKTLTELPEIDILIAMGCNVECPFLPCRYREDWGLEDPSGKGREQFILTAKTIEDKVKDLARRLKNNELY